MRLLLITGLAAGLAAPAAGSPAPPAPPAPAPAAPTTQPESPIAPGRPDLAAPTATLQPPAGADFEVRLDAFAADLEAVLRQGLLTEAEAASAAARLAGLREELAAVRGRNAGKLPEADAARLQERVAALRKQTAELVAASRMRQAGR
jgi:hypothetical protein